MFSGIVQEVSSVIGAERRGTSRIVHIKKPRTWRPKLGASIAVNGVCSTVRARGATYFEVEYMPETLDKTTAGTLKKGDRVNLERSLRMTEMMDGHFVQGHVDARGKVTAVRVRGASREVTIRAPKALMRLFVKKGSVTVNGVALTVTVMKGNTFSVALVSHTLKHTNLRELTVGDEVNIETDMIARYLARLSGK